jgi:hypothetical protein
MVYTTFLLKKTSDFATSIEHNTITEKTQDVILSNTMGYLIIHLDVRLLLFEIS